MNEKKWLVDLIGQFTRKEIFFFTWFVIAAGFCFLILNQVRKNSRRNFRSPQQGPGRVPRVDARQLPSARKNLGKSSEKTGE